MFTEVVIEKYPVYKINAEFEGLGCWDHSSANNIICTTLFTNIQFIVYFDKTSKDTHLS